VITYLLMRMRSFEGQGALLQTFYDSVVALAIFYGVVCMSASRLLTGSDSTLVKKASSVLGSPLDTVEMVLVSIPATIHHSYDSPVPQWAGTIKLDGCGSNARQGLPYEPLFPASSSSL
ncbi:hypothetical protein KUCAC02_001755, partial [Chaenocephalus aceratus]